MRLLVGCAAIAVACGGDRPEPRTASAAQAPVPLVSVSAGEEHSCAVAAAGQAYCWGFGEGGQLGDGTGNDRTRPVRVAGTYSFRSIAAGGAHTCALTVDGKAYCWGGNESGELGRSDVEVGGSPTPVPVEGGLVFERLSAGAWATCGITRDGQLYCWGRVAGDSIGGTPARVPPPDEASGFGAVAVSPTHACAITTDGRLFCWGRFLPGVRPARIGEERAEPRGLLAVARDQRFSTVSVAGAQTCAVTKEGGALCWGYNRSGELGTGRLGEDFFHADAEPARGKEQWRVIATTSIEACGISVSGVLSCWGAAPPATPQPAGWSACPGGGSILCATEPQPVAPRGWGFTEIDAGGRHVCAITIAGDLYCRGRNTWGQLGDGTTTDSFEPRRVAVP